VTLNSFIVSVTPEAQIPWGGHVTSVDWTASHVLFQGQHGYVGLLFSLLTTSPGAREASNGE
jgi:hypothetical protein